MNFLLDTNVVITGILVPDSSSRALIDAHIMGDCHTYICRTTFNEAKKAFERASKGTGVDLWGAFATALKQVGIKVLPDVNEQISSRYDRIRGKADQRILAVAVKHKCSLVTNDISDFRYSEYYGVQVFTPSEFAANPDDKLSNIVLGFLATPSSGAFYVEVDALWAQSPFPSDLEKRFYIFDAEVVGGLFYDNRTRSLAFEGINNQEVRLELPPINRLERPIKVALCYDNNVGFSMYHGYRGQKSHWSGSWQSPDNILSPKIYVGCNRKIEDHLNGWLYRLASMPRCLSESAVNNLMSGMRNPEPWERLSLEEIIGFWYA